MGRVRFFETPDDAPRYKACVRGSPNRFKYQAGVELLLEVQAEAKAHQVAREVR